MPHELRGPFVASSAPTYDNPAWLTSLDEYAALYSTSMFNVQDPDYGAVGDGVTDDTVAIQAALNAAASGASGGTVWLPPGRYKLGALTMPDRVRLAGSLAQGANSTQGSIILGTTGTNVLTLGAGFDNHNRIEGITFIGGKNQIVANGQVTFVYIDNCVFSTAGEAAIRVLAGSIEEWYVSNVRASAGQYFYKHDKVDVAGNNYIDKVHFFNVLTGGQSINNYRIEVALSNTVDWTKCIFNTSGQHGLYATGGIRAWDFYNANTEGIGQTGKQNRTTFTGTVSSGATGGTLASGTGWATGDGMTIAGAGANGTDFTILSTAQGGPGVNVSGVTVSWAGGTSTTVTNPVVTNAEWDEFHFGTFLAGNPTHINFFGGQIGGAGTNSKLRYAINASQAFDVNLYGVFHIDLPAVVYDPLKSVNVFAGTAQVRRPASVSQTKPLFNHDGIKPTTKAGAPTDADFAQTPPNGTIAVDETNSKIYVRIGGTWKSTGALT